jgi:hypothetical protein
MEMNLNLPPLDSPQAPQIASLEQCKKWLAALPLTNMRTAQGEIAAQLAVLNRYPVTPLARLKVAEHLRETVNFIQTELAKKYQKKPIPLAEVEQATWDSVVGLWHSMGLAYRHCLQAAADGEAEAVGHIALITQRCLRYTTLQMLEHFRVYRQLDENLWAQLHMLYRFAEDSGFATRPMKDSLNRHNEMTTCSAAYVHALLLYLAHPYELSPRQLAVLDKWLDKWALRVPLVIERPAIPDVTPRVVDLAAGGPPLVTGTEPLATPRYLDSERLASGIRKRIKFLRKGGSPTELDMGEECVQPGCESFMAGLYQHWCEAPVQRSAQRRSGQDKVQAVFGMALPMHYFVSGGKPFVQPDQEKEISWQELQDFQMFGYVRNRTEQALSVAPLGYVLETWKIQDESALGFCLHCDDAANRQVRHNQLLAILPSDSATFVLAVVKWLSLDRDGGMRVGVHTLPGAVSAISARRSALNAAVGNKFVPAFLLPQVPALQAPQNLVLPQGWFFAGGVVEIFHGTLKEVKMLTLLEKGSDFERVSFAEV